MQWEAPYPHIYLSVPQESKSRSRVVVARPLGRNSTVGSSLSTHLSIEQEQEQCDGSQAPQEEQYSGKLLHHINLYVPTRSAEFW